MASTNITVVGCGWLGTALAHGARVALKEVEIVGHDKDLGNQRRAEQLKAVDKTNWNLPAACENGRLIFLAIPDSEIEPTLKAIGPYVPVDAVIVGVCPSIQTTLAAAARHLPARVAYVACDVVFDPNSVSADLPIEQVSAAVFRGAAWVITPRPGTDQDAVAAVASLAASLEAHPIFMDGLEHDGLRLAVDALPSAVGAAYLAAVANDDAWRERLWLAGAAFGTVTTGVEATDAGGIAKALVEQRAAGVHWLNQVMLALMDLRDAVDKGDVQRVQAAIERAQDRRVEWLNAWHRGRSTGGAQQDVPKQSFAGLFLGERLADRLKSGRR